VIWGHINGDIANSIGEELELVVKEIRKNWIQIWRAVGMLKCPLSSVSYDWEIKEHALDILSSILDGNSLDEPKGHFDVSSFVPSIFTALQVTPFLGRSLTVCFIQNLRHIRKPVRTEESLIISVTIVNISKHPFYNFLLVSRGGFKCLNYLCLNHASTF
jgi:hypothetical protein